MSLGRYLLSWLESPRRRERRLALRELRRSLLLIVDLEALAASLANRLHEIFDPECLAIFERRDDDLRAIFFRGPTGERDELAELSAEGRLARWLEVNQECWNAREHREVFGHLASEEQELLAGLGCRLCAPMIAKNQVIGLIILGARSRGLYFRPADAALLLQIAEQASLAFQNASLYREQEERLDRLHRADRLAAVGQLAAGVAHEVRNPLTAIRSTMQYLSQSLENERRELVGDLIAEVDRIDHIIDGLLGLSRPDDFRPRSVDLAEVLGQTLRLIDIRSRKQGVRIEQGRTEPLRIEADPAQLKQVFLNILLNALQAMGDGGQIRVECRRLVERPSSREAGWAQILIEDDGPGIPDEIQTRIFDPFFTTKKDGTGLGLSICQNVVEHHGGSLRLGSRVGEGTTITLLFPIESAGLRE